MIASLSLPLPVLNLDRECVPNLVPARDNVRYGARGLLGVRRTHMISRLEGGSGSDLRLRVIAATG